MRKIKYLPVLLILISCCKQRSLSLEELIKAKWDSLTQGVEYISTQNEKGIAFKSDSIDMKIKGVSQSEITPAEMSLTKIPPEINKALSSVLKLYLPDSKSGYLRVNIAEMTKPGLLWGRIYLRGDYSAPFSFQLDSIALLGIPGIRLVRFISKEKAKEEYLADGNPDWSKVLDVNPLPNSIEINLDNKEWNKESLNDLKSSIQSKLIMASDIIFPNPLFKKSDEYYFFEYKRG